MYIRRGLPGLGGTRTGGLARYALILSKARWQSSFQMVGEFFLNTLKIGSKIGVNWEMKRLIFIIGAGRKKVGSVRFFP